MMTDTQTEMETVEITMPGYQLGGALRAVAHAMCQDLTRGSLEGVLMDVHRSGEISLVATYGLTLFVYTFEPNRSTHPDVLGSGAYHLSEEMVRATIAAAKTCKKLPITLTLTPGHAELRAAGTTVRHANVQVKFPPWRRVLPDLVTRKGETATCPVGVDVMFLGRVAAAVKDAQSAEGRRAGTLGATMHVAGDCDPIVFVAEGPPLTCVVMPRSL
jgi:hypothetical protein